jgi:hypothetical protein
MGVNLNIINQNVCQGATNGIEDIQLELTFGLNNAQEIYPVS